MIRLGKTKWLPSLRFGLTPFGSEWILENHLLINQNIFEISIRQGDNKLDDFWGLGIKFRNRLTDFLSIGSKIDIWSQPEMELGGNSIYQTKRGLGGRVLGELNYEFNASNPMGIYTQIGYKTSGFIEGEQLRRKVIFRIGLQLIN